MSSGSQKWLVPLSFYPKDHTEIIRVWQVDELDSQFLQPLLRVRQVTVKDIDATLFIDRKIKRRMSASRLRSSDSDVN